MAKKSQAWYSYWLPKINETKRWVDGWKPHGKGTDPNEWEKGLTDSGPKKPRPGKALNFDD